MVAFLKKHWLWIVGALVALGFVIASPGTIGQLLGAGIAACGFLAHLVKGGSDSGRADASKGNLPGAKADVDSGIAGLGSAAADGVRRANESASRLSDAKGAVDDGASAIEDALRQDRQGKGS